jgi:eukaryotic-like serine/threonine-protein kinase
LPKRGCTGKSIIEFEAFTGFTVSRFHQLQSNAEMKNYDWQKVKEVFLDALEIDTGKRNDFIAAACQGNTTMQIEVESLIASHKAAEEIYDRPAAEMLTIFAGSPENFFAPPQRVGNYKIIREIGRGGMGAVYLAERDDEEFKKQVAVKFIKNSFGDKESVRRFRQERQILAALEHPNIARLLDGGTFTAAGTPFLVMEFVDGVPLNEFCEENLLSTNERLQLFVQICEGVQFAHRNLIVHRDLKPSNILVTADGVPKLLDFGIAKLLDANFADISVETATAQRLLTPAYASPEQSRGENVTTATDVYSLGVILSELVGKPDSELQAIIEKARREEPDRRYSSVEQFAEDVRRFLTGLPVLARKGSLSYRIEKFIKRNRTAVAAVILLLLAIVTGIAATLWQANATRQQAKIAAAERDRAQLARTKAERINAFLQQMLSAASPEKEGREVKVVEILESAEKQAEQDLADQPDILAAALLTIGNTYSNLAQYEPAERILRRSVQLYQKNPTENQRETAQALGDLADVLEDMKRYAEAEPLMRQCVEIVEHLEPRSEDAIAIGLAHLGRTLRGQGNDDAAEPVLQKALTLAQQGKDEKKVAMLFALHELSLLRSNRGDFTSEVEIYRQIIPLLRNIPEEKTNLTTTLTNMAVTLIYEGQLNEAESALLEGMQMRRELFGEDNLYFANSVVHLGRLRLAQGRYAEAEAEARKAAAFYSRLLPPTNPWNGVAANILGNALAKQGKLREGESYLRRGLEFQRKSFAANSWQIGNLEGQLGECLSRQNRFHEAEPLLLQSYEKIKANLGSQRKLTIDALQRIIQLYENSAQPEKAADFRKLFSS